MWYGTIAHTWQWTGTYWHGNTAPWSGYIWFDCSSCLTRAEPVGAPIGVPTITPVAPAGRPGLMRPAPASGAAIPVSTTVSAAVLLPAR